MKATINKSTATGMWVVRYIDVTNGIEIERREFRTKIAASWFMWELIDRMGS